MHHNSYRDNKQRFHKGRQGSILVPHNALSGLLFTVNPRQDVKAFREAQLFLTSLTTELRAAHERYLAKAETGHEHGDSDVEDNVGAEVSGCEGHEKEAPRQRATTASLLAAELAEAIEERGGKRKRAREEGVEDISENDNNNDDDREEAREKPKRSPASQKWFASLETSCKGYMMLNIPAVNPTKTCVVSRAGSSGASDAANDAAEQEKGASHPQLLSQLPPHSIVANPLVSHVVERVFADLLGKNASPVFRHCFRLMPAELTCCPTPAEMQQAVKMLLHAHFPSPTPDAGSAEATLPQDGALSFAGPIPFAAPTSHAPATPSAEPKKARHMFTVALHFNVKNNTNVEAKKAQFQSQLQNAIPMNRFIVMPSSLLARKNATVDAVLCVNVIHATCLMGVQRMYHERRAYNLHDLSEDTLELANSVVATTAKES